MLIAMRKVSSMLYRMIETFNPGDCFAIKVITIKELIKNCPKAAFGSISIIIRLSKNILKIQL